MNLVFLFKKKEVIHPQVPLRIPCDDLTPLTESRIDIPNKRTPLLNPTWLV